MRWAVAASLLLLALVPPPSAAASSWGVEATMAVVDATEADYTWRITGLTNTRLTLPVPDEATFVEARDADGRTLATRMVGDDVEVTIQSKPAILRFRVSGAADGPFVSFPAQVAANADSPVTLALTLPAGWSVAGYRDNDCVDEDDATPCEPPTSDGVFTKTGPAYVQLLTLPPGHDDPGPDLDLVGRAVRREGIADVREDGVTWSLVTTYNTEIWSRDWEVHIPEGGRLTRAYTPFGPLATTPTADGVKVRTPYPVGFGLGGRSFTVEMELPPATPHGGPFRLANLSVRAAEGDIVRIEATLPDDATYTGARLAGGREVAPLRYEADGPLSVGLAYLPAAAPGHVRFAEGAFVVDAPSALADAARVTARNATELLPRVAGFAHDAADTRPFFAAYTDEHDFGWEEGFYSNGLNTMTIRASTLERSAADGKPHLVPVGVLLHESTHALIDRAFPDAPRELSFLHEGLSRLAETRAEAMFADEIVQCRQILLEQRCDRHSARPDANVLRSRYLNGTTFQLAWNAQEVGDDERGILYDHSGLVLHAYTLRAPPGALENALAHVARTRFTDDPEVDAGILLDILLRSSPLTSAEALLYPGAEAASLPLGEFQHCLGELVAPPYPWEAREVRAPRGGCPDTGYGPQDAILPTPPTASETPPPTRSTPTPAPPPVVRVSPPVTQTPSPGLDPVDEDTPGAVAEPPRARNEGASNAVQIPATPALALAALAAVALLARRR